jgi:hypothetical protein
MALWSILGASLGFGWLLVCYPFNLFHEYSHYFMARALGVHVSEFKITVYEGITTFEPKTRVDALLILLAPFIAWCAVVDFDMLFFPLPWWFLFTLLLFCLPSPRDVKAILQAIAYNSEVKKTVEV